MYSCPASSPAYLSEVCGDMHHMHQLLLLPGDAVPRLLQPCSALVQRLLHLQSVAMRPAQLSHGGFWSFLSTPSNHKASNGIGQSYRECRMVLGHDISSSTPPAPGHQAAPGTPPCRQGQRWHVRPSREVAAASGRAAGPCISAHTGVVF